LNEFTNFARIIKIVKKFIVIGYHSTINIYKCALLFKASSGFELYVL